MEFKNAAEKAEAIITKHEAKGRELRKKVIKLDEDVIRLEGGVQADFQKAVMEDRTPNTALREELNQANAERESIRKMLPNMEAILQEALEAIRGETEADRERICEETLPQQKEIAVKLKDAKLAYLQLLVEYRNLVAKPMNELAEFASIEQRLKMERVPEYAYRIIPFRTDTFYETAFHPIMAESEVEGAYLGRLNSLAQQYINEKK
ncbi:hypothetical protein [Bacillus sp. XF8]|uniref:Uncharacterized protein n=1 Tax=Bacillus bingmayongensis TaxID=1150157 RepID=A0ABU5K1C5_9BACI|nr:hypothetical protein [Bacillus sp. XF8]MBO1582967.1 hypothetical protein [Bacillus sp. XF8]MDZ5609484.1 hypothetical protein [Bacillus pseudomycoides]